MGGRAVTARGGRPAPPWFRRWCADEQGAAIVEFAIVVPILLVLVMGIIDFGRMLAVAASLSAAVRDGARQAAASSDLTDQAQVTAIKTRVTTSFDPFGGAAIGTSGGGTLFVTAPDASGTVSVTVRGYEYAPITPIAALIGMGTVTLNRTATFRWERAR